MASPSATTRSALPLASSIIAYQVRAISESVSRFSELISSLRIGPAASLISDSPGLRRSPPSPPPLPPSPSAGAGANPRNHSSGVGNTFSPRQFTPFRGLDFSSRLHSWGAPARRNDLQFRAGGGGVLSGGGAGQQVRKIFVEVKGNDLDRAIRKWRRKCKEENLRALKDREYFKKPSEKRVLALKERDRRIARRSFKMKLNWILARRQRGF